MTQVIDNGNETVTIDANAPDARSMMLASASAIAAFVIDTEGKLSETAKAWGHALFRCVYQDKASSLDALIGDSKVAAGWNMLTSSGAGRKAKGRMEVYFSNARLVAERWEGMTDDQRRDVLAGLSSIHYLAGQFRKADADAKKAATKEAERLAAEQAAEQAKRDAEASGDAVNEPETETFAVNGLADAIALVAAMLANAEPGEVLAAADAFNTLAGDFDGAVNAALASEPVSLAA